MARHAFEVDWNHPDVNRSLIVLPEFWCGATFVEHVLLQKSHRTLDVITTAQILSRMIERKLGIPRFDPSCEHWSSSVLSDINNASWIPKNQFRENVKTDDKLPNP